MSHPMTGLAGAIDQAIGPQSGVRVGTVVSVDSSARCDVEVGGGLLRNVAYGAHYAPAPGDIVQIQRQESSWWIMGRIAGGHDGPLLGGGVVLPGSKILKRSGTALDLFSSTAFGAVSRYDITVTPRAGHLTLVWATMDVFTFTTGNPFLLQIREGSTSGPIVGEWAQDTSTQFVYSAAIFGWYLSASQTARRFVVAAQPTNGVVSVVRALPDGRQHFFGALDLGAAQPNLIVESF